MEGYDLLVQQAKQGDSDAFSRLYETVYQDLYRFALYTLKNTHDAEDVVSETVMDVWKQIPSLRKVESFKAWVFKILINKCKRRLKHYLTKTEELTENISCDSRDICEDMDVQKAFAALSEEERFILALNVFGGYSSREIGKTLFMSHNTVRSKQSRALKKMEENLKK